MGETHEDRHDGGDFGLPPAPPRRNNDAAHNNGHAAADAPLILKTLNTSVSLDGFWDDYMRADVCEPTNIDLRSM